MRAFIAIEIPAEVKKELRSLTAKLAGDTAGYRFTDPRTVHLTLKFLGETPREIFEKAAEIIRAGFEVGGPIKLCASGLGGFPVAGNARVVWVGLTGETEKLETLASEIDGAMGGLGFPQEKKPFHPHITIGRALRSGKPQGITKAAALHGGFAGSGFTADGITLFESILEPSGARHIAHARGPVL